MYHFRCKTRICNSTYFNEGGLPKGQKLLLCSKCKETWYLNRKEQRANWPIHKQTCIEIEKDDKRIHKTLSFKEARKLFQELLRNPKELIKGRLFFHVFRELARNCMERKDCYVTIRDEVVFHETFKREVIDHLQRNTIGGEAVMYQILTIPGFTNYLFQDDLLHVRVPIEAAFASSGAVLPRSYIQLISGLVVTLVMRASMNNGQLQVGIVDSMMAAALVRRVMYWWSCPLVRYSCPGLGRATAFFNLLRISTNMYEINRASNNPPIVGPMVKTSTLPYEIAPGMSVKTMLFIIMTDHEFIKSQCGPQLELFLANLVMLANGDPDAPGHGGAWNYLSSEDRDHLLDMYHGWELPISKDQDESMRPFAPMLAGFKTSVLYMIVGNTTKMILRMNDYLKSIPATEQHPDTIQLFKYLRAVIIGSEVEAAQTFVNFVEFKYEYRQRALCRSRGGKHYPTLCLPEELVQLITEYSLRERHYEFIMPGAEDAWKNDQFD